MVAHGLGTAILFQLMVAADYIVIDVQRGIYPKDPPPRMKGAGVDIPLMKRFYRALSLYTSPRGIGWSFELQTRPKPSMKPRLAFVSSRIAFASTLIRTFASAMINSNPALSRNTLLLRDMGWFYHTTGVFAFALNSVAQIDTVHCVLAAFCVGVGISGPQEWLDLFGSPFDAYSVQRFWGYVRWNPDVLDLTETLLSRRTWHQLLRRVSFIDAMTYLTHTNDRTSQPLKSCTIFVVTEVLNCPRRKPFTAFVFLNTVFFLSRVSSTSGANT